MLVRCLELAPEPAEITRLNAWLDGCFAEVGLVAGVAADMKLCLNEGIANAILYGFVSQPQPRLEVVLTLSRLVAAAAITDNGRPFNPLAWPRRDKLHGPAGDAVAGGFGIQLMRDTASAIEYERVGDQNRLRIVCRREAPDSRVMAEDVPSPP